MSQLIRIIGILAIILIFIIGFATVIVMQTRSNDLDPADRIVLKTQNMAYSATHLDARAGKISLILENADFVPHTFTIDALGVDLSVPKRGKGQITFSAPPGTYSFFCDIAGHPEAGMVGELVVAP